MNKKEALLWIIPSSLMALCLVLYVFTGLHFLWASLFGFNMAVLLLTTVGKRQQRRALEQLEKTITDYRIMSQKIE